AQTQAATNGYGYEPAPPQPPPGAPPVPTGSFSAPHPDTAAGAALDAQVPQRFYGGSTDEFGQLRDSIMQQFPSINDVGDGDLGFSEGEKMGLMGLAITNPNGALDLIRQ